MSQTLPFPAQRGTDEPLWPRLVEAMVDDLGPDFSGIRAHAALELHMKECAERRAEDRADRHITQERLNAMQQSFDERMLVLTKTFDERMLAMNNRMWTAAASLIAVLMAALGYFISLHIK